MEKSVRTHFKSGGEPEYDFHSRHPFASFQQRKVASFKSGAVRQLLLAKVGAGTAAVNNTADDRSQTLKIHQAPSVAREPLFSLGFNCHIILAIVIELSPESDESSARLQPDGYRPPYFNDFHRQNT